MDVMGWVMVALLLCLVLAILTYLKQNQGVGAAGEERRRPQEAVVRGPGGRRGGARMRRPVERDDSEEEAGQEEREELEEAGIKVPDGKIGKKKMEKLQAKAEKKLQREGEQKEREDNKKKRDKMDEEDKQKREKEQEQERRVEEEEKKVREEKEKREQEEYEQLKAAFSVEDEGCDAGEEGDEENKLLKFINYIKETKVVLLEDLAAQFHLKTQEVIDRVTQLQADGMLTGVIDDRGKFIYISQVELEAVAKFIRQQGRVSITDLAMSSNQLITL
eukprot:GFUD01027254.1.p1 GENE.GFUD01027254.1~~GFUD01027254.1.p1  ORF type:complete len:276 (-),score=146.33 GFUD01027254.1:60-887(-)